MLLTGINLRSQVTLSVISWLTFSASFCVNVYMLVQQAWQKTFLTGAVLAPAIVFLVLGHKKVPVLYTAIFVMVCGINVVSMGWGLYSSIPHLDEFAHFITGFALVPCCVHFLLHPVIDYFKRAPLSFFLIGLSIGLGVGALWEILEWLIHIEADYLDTITDLVFDGLGAGLAAFWATLRLRTDVDSRDLGQMTKCA